MAVNRQWGSYSDICVHYLHGSAFGVQWNCGTFLLNSVAFERRQIRKAGTVEAVALCIRNEFFGLFFFLNLIVERKKIRRNKKSESHWDFCFSLGGSSHLWFLAFEIFFSLLGKLERRQDKRRKRLRKKNIQIKQPNLLFFSSFLL